MGILSTGQARQFALGGVYGEGEPPMKDFYNPTDGYQGNEPILPPLQLAFPSPTQPPLGGYTIGDMQNNVEGINPYYSIFDNNSNGLNFRYDQRAPEVPVNQQYTNQTSTTLNSSTDNSDSQSFGNDYNAYLADAKKYQGKYRDAQSVDDAFTSGLISQQERDRLQLLSPEQLKAETKPLSDDQNIDMNAVKGMDAMRYMNPVGQDFGTNMFQLGRSISAEKGTPGKGLGIIANAGAGILDLARNVGSGMAYQNMNDQTRNYYQDLMKRRQYTNASQTQNANITGGVSSYKEGGLHSGPPIEDNMIYPPGDNQWDSSRPPLNYDILEMQQQRDRRGYDNYLNSLSDPTNINRASKRFQQEYFMNSQNTNAREGGLFQNQHFALGGEQQPSEEEQMMMQQQAQQQQGESQGQPEEQEAPAPEQIMQVAQQLVEGLKSLEAIDAYLKEQGVDQETYVAIMQAAQQILEGGAPQEEAPTMRGGGTFKHKVGDKIEFTHKGKKHRGTIKKIENGQIYL